MRALFLKNRSRFGIGSHGEGWGCVKHCPNRRTRVLGDRRDGRDGVCRSIPAWSRDGAVGLCRVPTKLSPSPPRRTLTNLQRSTGTLQGSASLLQGLVKAVFYKELSEASERRVDSRRAAAGRSREPGAAAVLTETLCLSIVLAAPGICCRSQSWLQGALCERSAGQTLQPCPAVRALPQTRCFRGRPECPQLLIPSCCLLQSPQKPPDPPQSHRTP